MKGIEFLGTSLKMVREFPALAKKEAGYQLDRVQRGLEAHEIGWPECARDTHPI